MSTQYFQAGGLKPHIYSVRSLYDDKALAEAIAGPSSPLRPEGKPDDPVELVLGIKAHGSSHLLLTRKQTELIKKAPELRSNMNSPLFRHNFESLSPIYFHSVQDLSQKLSSLKQKPTKNKKQVRSWAKDTSKEEDTSDEEDTSPANRIYRKYSKDLTPLFRGAFEHGRVIYRILNHTIDASKYGVDDTTWTRNFSVTSFVFNTKGVDDRPSHEKLKNPIVLDVGFCNACLPSFEPDYTAAQYLLNQANSKLGGPGGKRIRPFNQGESKKIASAEMPVRIQEFFKDYRSKTSKPMILLVYNQQLTENYLHNMGVDMSAWVDGVKDLITPKNFSMRSRSRSPSRPSYRDHKDHEHGDYTRRTRSRSPHGDNRSRQNSRTSFPSSQNQRHSETHASPSSADRTGGLLYPPVLIVDVHQLYVKLMRNNQVTGVVDTACHFGLPVADVNGFCAGNEAGLLIEIWKAMISGPPIDEQNQLRSNGEQPASQPQKTPGAGPSNVPQPLADSDDEQDPNDVVSRPQAAQPSSKGPYNFDESDYGNSSDSD